VNLLQHIAQSREELRKSELKVAEHVLADPSAVMHSSMADLAHEVGVSEPTIVRFCRAIGCAGFQDLKLKLAQSLASGSSFGQFSISEGDSVADVSLKIFDATLHTLIEVREHLDTSAVERAVQAIAAACAAPGLRVDFALPGNARLPEHRAIARDAWRVELVTPRTMLESLKVLRVGPREIAQHRDGLSLTSPLVVGMTCLGLFDRSRAPGPDDMAVTQQVQDFNAKIEATPAFFAMVTEANDRATQVQAGRAYARAQLAATAHGLAMHPLQQALQEYPEQAPHYAAIHALLGAGGGRGTVQMWARLGYAPPVGPAPRRGVQAHLLG